MFNRKSPPPPLHPTLEKPLRQALLGLSLPMLLFPKTTSRKGRKPGIGWRVRPGAIAGFLALSGSAFLSCLGPREADGDQQRQES